MIMYDWKRSLVYYFPFHFYFIVHIYSHSEDNKLLYNFYYNHILNNLTDHNEPSTILMLTKLKNDTVFYRTIFHFEIDLFNHMRTLWLDKLRCNIQFPYTENVSDSINATNITFVDVVKTIRHKFLISNFLLLLKRKRGLIRNWTLL